MANYTAKTQVVTIIGGLRVTIQPGDSIPDGIHKHDLKELLAMGSIEDGAKERADALDFEAARREGALKFEEIKLEIAQERESSQGQRLPVLSEPEAEKPQAEVQPGQDAGIEGPFDAPKPEAKAKKPSTKK